MNSIINSIAEYIKTQEWIKPFIRRFFNPLRERYWRDLVGDKRMAYENYGLETLKRFHQCMESCNVKYSLAFGSVLGAIREHGFIKHDLDIDVFLRIDRYKKEIVSSLLDSGFVWKCKYSIRHDLLGREDTFEYHGCSIDIFYLYPIDAQSSYCCDFLISKENKNRTIPRKIVLPITGNDVREEQFEGISVYVPLNAEEFCRARYGDSYMQPNPEWSCRDNNESVSVWEEVIKDTKVIHKPVFKRHA